MFDMGKDTPHRGQLGNGTVGPGPEWPVISASKEIKEASPVHEGEGPDELDGEGVGMRRVQD